MTTVYEVRFTNPEDFIAELKADAAVGQIADRIVRVAVRKSPARFRDLWPDKGFDNRPAGWWRLRYVEASYLNTRGQLVKVSVYCGVIWNETDKPEPTIRGEHVTEATEKAAEEARNKLTRAFNDVGDLTIRSGSLAVEDGPWMPAANESIDAPPVQLCATCGLLIYWANDAWRHRGQGLNREFVFGKDDPLFGVRVKVGRAEADTVQLCPDCVGTKTTTEAGRERLCRRCNGLGSVELLHHLADPEIVDRKV